jgi:hypothetical protein
LIEHTLLDTLEVRAAAELAAGGEELAVHGIGPAEVCSHGLIGKLLQGEELPTKHGEHGWVGASKGVMKLAQNASRAMAPPSAGHLHLVDECFLNLVEKDVNAELPFL